MERATHQERTFVILKTDTIQRSLMGEVIARFERAGLKVTAMKLAMPSEELLQTHYNKDDEWFEKKGQGVVKDMEAQGMSVEKEPIEYGRDIIRTVVRYMTEAPVLAMVLEGSSAVNAVMKIVGTTEPTTADIGTIRGDYTVDSYAHATLEDRAVKNLIHCSDCVEEAERELSLWFGDDEIHDYVTAQERILYEAIRNRS